jgi:drug/metabolite transporter (DMT)-like permease
MIFFFFMLLIFKKVGSLGIKESTILLYVFAIGALFYLIYSFISNNPIKVNWQILGLLFIAAIFSCLGNIFHVKALISAPNPGYADAVSSTRILLLTIAAIFLFHSEKLTLMKVFGIIFTVAGLLLLGV